MQRELRPGGKSRAQFPEISVVYSPSQPYPQLLNLNPSPDTSPGRAQTSGHSPRKGERKEDNYIGQQEGAEGRG